MRVTPIKLNAFLFFKLPAAFICGVRVRKFDDFSCVTSVKHRWINQNPFRSLFWAVQGMAAELSTGVLILNKIRASGKSIAIILVKNEASYFKKATGRIVFQCKEGEMIDKVIKEAIETGEGQTITLDVFGKNSDDVEVSHSKFTWSMKLRSQN